MFKLLPLLFASASMSQMPKTEEISIRVNRSADCGLRPSSVNEADFLKVCSFIKDPANSGQVGDIANYISALIASGQLPGGTGTPAISGGLIAIDPLLEQAINSFEGTTGFKPDKLNMLMSSVNQLKNQMDTMKNSLTGGTVNPLEMQNIQHELNYLLGSLPENADGTQKTLEQVKESLGQLQSSLTSEQKAALAAQYGTKLDQLAGMSQKIDSIEGTMATFMSDPNFKEMLKTLANQSPEMLKDLQESGLVNQQSIQNMQAIHNIVPPGLKIPKSVLKMATSIDRTVTVFMWCLAGILFLFGTVGLISSMNTLRYKTLITHKKLFKNPKFLFITWLLVLLGAVGSALGALYG